MRYYLAALFWTVVSMIPPWRPCDRCGGYGQIVTPEDEYIDCGFCRGRGRR